MLYLAIILLVITLIAGVLGFGGLAAVSFGFAKIIFLVAVVFLLASALFSLYHPQG